MAFERRKDLFERNIVDVRAFPVAVADVQPHAVARDAGNAVVDRLNVTLDALDEAINLDRMIEIDPEEDDQRAREEENPYDPRSCHDQSLLTMCLVRLVERRLMCPIHL